ncbi:MAG: UDP-N-acetylmuramate--L-alanine ligase [Candidatus Liptonbacteria bacterium]|nr:UDP-N-acetylmuramate--L-alanine ligase [Candidatus Liptonbacteria bacterium]
MRNTSQNRIPLAERRVKSQGSKVRGRVHLIGIGGIGVSYLARWFLAQNWAVSGSDLISSEITRELSKEGVNIKIGHRSSHLPRNADLVIYSQAIQPENPERRAAERLGLRTISFPQAVGWLTEEYRTVAVSGAHGKSTTTALAALITVVARLDPTVFVGTKLKEFGGSNFRIGKSDLLILEADEYGRAFLNYTPTYAVVTNIDREHLDVYRSLADIQRTFCNFLARVKPGGVLVLNRDNPPLWQKRKAIERKAKSKKVRVVWYGLQSAAARKVRKVLKIPGEHNVSNATAAFELARALKIPERTALRAIGRFAGTWRRMEYKGELRIENREFSKEQLNTSSSSILTSKFSLLVYDDYAHHPTEIRATLAAFRQKYPHSPIVCVFQPHQARRLRLLFSEFATAFGDADAVVFIPMYAVAGRDTADPRFTSQTLAHAVQRKYPAKKVIYLADPKNLKITVGSLLLPTPYSPLTTPILVLMGAGNIVDLTDRLLS